VDTVGVLWWLLVELYGPHMPRPSTGPKIPGLKRVDRRDGTADRLKQGTEKAVQVTTA